MESNELQLRLMNDAMNYDASRHTQALLSPYRDVLLVQRAKYMSYEQIAATLTRFGIKTSTTSVGVFCRHTFTKADIERTRQALKHQNKQPAIAMPPVGPPPGAPTSGVSAPGPSSGSNGRRGPRIARDNY